MNKIKRIARKRFIRQTVNQAKLEGGNIVPKNTKSFPVKDKPFALEVAAKQKPYTTTTPFRARIRALFGVKTNETTN